MTCDAAAVQPPTPALQQTVAGCLRHDLVIDVVTCQLNSTNAEIARQRIALLIISRARWRTASSRLPKENDDVRTGTLTE